MKCKFTFWWLSFQLIGLIISLPAQELSNIKNLSAQTPSISGGAENSIFIAEQKRLGKKSLIYNVSNSVQQSRENNLISTINTIEGIDFDEDAALNGFYHIPPDPMGVIGPNHLVAVNNTSIEIFDRAGATLSSQGLSAFFTSLTPLTNTFDPKVIYDQYNDRFVVVTLERTNDGTDSTSKIFIAVSATNDPTGTWYFHSINSKIDIGGMEHWADYPGFAIGENAIYITCNLFQFTAGSFGGVRLWVVDKGTTSGFYSGAAATVNIFDPILAGGIAITLQPAHMFGISPPSVGTYLIGFSLLNNGADVFLEYYTVGNSTTSPSITFSGYLNMGPIFDLTISSYPNAPQLGTSIEIETNDPRTFNAVWRDNYLYTGTFIVPSTGIDAGQTTVHWVKINTNTGIITDQGDIGGEDIGSGTHTFFPSVAVNRIGEMLVGFAASGPAIYPGAYYTVRFPYDPVGTVQSSKTLKAGLDFYVRTFTTGSTGRNRWGDYSGSSVDPLNDITFCLFNEYALTRGTEFGGEDGRWGTVFGILPNLDITILLEGPYSGSGSMTTGSAHNSGIPLSQPFNEAPWNYAGNESIASLPPNIADWILVTLRKDLNPSIPDPTTAVAVASRAAFLKINGKIVDLDGSSNLGFFVEPGDYYVVVQHKNHLAVMTPTAIAIN